MIFRETELKGAFLVELEKKADERGYFARAWCQKEFQKHDLVSTIVQSNVSFSRKAGTLRGMHYQAAPFQETKLIRCMRGAIYDVIIDLRPQSSTYKKWVAVELTEDNHRMLYVPKDFAHGFQSLTDDVEVFYHVSQFYSPEAERGIRWNDPQFGIQWPEVGNRTISDKDRNWAAYKE
jgi:dTDP-4-dehydrorhamnose 3,5-epimerase